MSANRFPIWSPLTMTYTDNGREIGRIEEVGRRDPYDRDALLQKWSATWIRRDGHRVGMDFDFVEHAQAYIENAEREWQALSQRIAAE